MGIHWSREKSEQLKRIRGVSFEDVIQAEFVGTTDHPGRPNQTMLFFRIDDYIWAVPCVIQEGDIFLKTLYPSRKAHETVEIGRALMNSKRMRLTREEKAIEDESLAVYRPVSPEKFKMIAEAIARRRKDAVLNIRINSYDLASIKEKAKKAGIPYQTLISEFLHEYAISPKI